MDVVSDMCCFNLRGRDGGLMRKPTRWLGNCLEILQMLDCRCSGDHDHEECMGPNTKIAQVYTYELAHAIVSGFQAALQSGYDERCLLSNFNFDEMPVLNMSEEKETFLTDTSNIHEILYADVIQDVEQWRPLLSEAQQRLEGKVATSAEVKRDTAFFEQISNLAPGWKLAYVQIYRAPKQRRLPAKRVLEGEDPITHRAAAYLGADGMITVESESVSSMTNVGSKLDRHIAYAIFLYGEAPATEFGEQNEKAQPPLTQQQRQAARQNGYKEFCAGSMSTLVILPMQLWSDNLLRQVPVNKL
eukprot:s529_g16.t1